MYKRQGEINTIRGNADKMLAREENMESPYLEGEMQKILPVVNRNGSDSAMLDNTLEFLTMSGDVYKRQEQEHQVRYVRRIQGLFFLYKVPLEPGSIPAQVLLLWKHV